MSFVPHVSNSEPVDPEGSLSASAAEYEVTEREISFEDFSTDDAEILLESAADLYETVVSFKVVATTDGFAKLTKTSHFTQSVFEQCKAQLAALQKIVDDYLEAKTNWSEATYSSAVDAYECIRDIRDALVLSYDASDSELVGETPVPTETEQKNQPSEPKLDQAAVTTALTNTQQLTVVIDSLQNREMERYGAEKPKEVTIFLTELKKTNNRLRAVATGLKELQDSEVENEMEVFTEYQQVLEEAVENIETLRKGLDRAAETAVDASEGVYRMGPRRKDLMPQTLEDVTSDGVIAISLRSNTIQNKQAEYPPVVTRTHIVSDALSSATQAALGTIEAVDPINQATKTDRPTVRSWEDRALTDSLVQKYATSEQCRTLATDKKIAEAERKIKQTVAQIERRVEDGWLQRVVNPERQSAFQLLSQKTLVEIDRLEQEYSAANRQVLLAVEGVVYEDLIAWLDYQQDLRTQYREIFGSTASPQMTLGSLLVQTLLAAQFSVT